MEDGVKEIHQVRSPQRQFVLPALETTLQTDKNQEGRVFVGNSDLFSFRTPYRKAALSLDQVLGRFLNRGIETPIRVLDRQVRISSNQNTIGN